MFSLQGANQSRLDDVFADIGTGTVTVPSEYKVQGSSSILESGKTLCCLKVEVVLGINDWKLVKIRNVQQTQQKLQSYESFFLTK